MHRQGGLSDNEDNLAPLTAFTLIALLEMHADDVSAQPALSKLLETTLPCLQEPDDDAESQDLYTVALTTYALAVAGRTDDARERLTWLLDRAHNNNSLTWWEKPGKKQLPLEFNLTRTNFVQSVVFVLMFKSKRLVRLG